MEQISAGQILFGINAVIIAVVGYFIRSWMDGIRETLKEQKVACLRETELLWVEVRILRDRSHDQATQIMKRVEWEYCRDCPKRTNNGQ